MSVTLFTILVLAFFLSIGAYLYFVGPKFGFQDKVLALAKSGKIKEAKLIVKDKIDLKPDDIELHFLLSKLHKMEGDLDGEAADLEKIISIGKFTKEISHLLVSTRLSNIYYQLDKYDESFFYYMELLEGNPGNLEALVRLSFMAIGQREFEVAEHFLKQIPDEQIKLSSFFIAKGVVSTMLGKENDFDYYQKAYELDKGSQLAKFLYAFALFQRRKFKEALSMVDSLIDSSREEVIKYSFLQFLMVQYICLKDIPSALLNARLCMELAKNNSWEEEIAESNLHFAMLCISSNEIEKSTESLIEAEFLKPHDPDIIALANYKFELEENIIIPGATSPKGFNLQNFIASIPEKLFPPEKAYEISSLKMPVNINIKGIISKEGKRIINKITQLSPDKIIKFNGLRGLPYKNACSRVVGHLGFKIRKEIPGLESEGLNLLCSSKEDDNYIALFRFRRWKQSNLSDIFLSEMLNSMAELGAVKGYLVASCELTSGAKKFLKSNDGKIVVVSDRALDAALDSALKT